MPFEPGDIYWAYLNERPRPVVIVSRECLNRGDYVTIVPITSAKVELRRDLPSCVAFRAGEYGLRKNCVAQGENITTIQKSQLDLRTGRAGKLDGATVRDLIRAVGYVIRADCEPEAHPETRDE